MCSLTDQERIRPAQELRPIPSGSLVSDLVLVRYTPIPVQVSKSPGLQDSRSGILDDAFGWLSMQRRPPFPSPVCGRDAFALAACQARVSGIRQGVFLLIIGSQ